MRKLLWVLAFIGAALNVALAQSSTPQYVRFVASAPDLKSIPASSNEGCSADTARIDAIGTAQVTHLGITQVTEVVCLNPVDLTFTTHFTLKAATGDQIFATAAGYGVPTSATTFTVHGVWVFVSGTGRFAGVSGNGTATGDVDLVSGASPHLLTGLISSVGSAQRN